MLISFSFARFFAPPTCEFRTAQREDVRSLGGPTRQSIAESRDVRSHQEAAIRHDWKIRVQPAERKPFGFKATFLQSDSPDDERALDVLYAYGDGDLAVLLQDLGADTGEICGLLDRLQQRNSAEILVNVSDEAMEVLSRTRPRA